jgi:hypothetical protein
MHRAAGGTISVGLGAIRFAPGVKIEVFVDFAPASAIFSANPRDHAYHQQRFLRADDE